MQNLQRAKFGLLDVGYNVIFNLVFMYYLGVVGIALSTSVVSAIFLGSLLWKLKQRLGSIRGMHILRSSFRILVATLVMGVAVWGASWFCHTDLQLGGESGRVVNVLLPVATGMAVYAVALFALKVEEAHLVLGSLRKAVRKRR